MTRYKRQSEDAIEICFDAEGVRGCATLTKDQHPGLDWGDNPRDKPAPPTPRKKLTPWQMLKGAVGLLKAEYGVDAVDDETYAKRKATCEGCDQYDFGVCGGAKGCNCYLAAKIRIKGESCPIGKW